MCDQPTRATNFLAGIRILDFTQNLPGPYATFLLAGWGAEVIKVEPPTGDPGRALGAIFPLLHRGKRGVVLDLKAVESTAKLRALVRWADVLVEGFRPGVMERLGAGFAQARAWNPSLIYASISAYGQAGPRAREPGHDLNIQALSGIAALEARGGIAPPHTLIPVADYGAGLSAALSICAALVARKDVGVHLDVAMCDSAVLWAQAWRTDGDAPGTRGPPGRLASVTARLGRPLTTLLRRQSLFALPHYGVFRTADGQRIALAIVDEGHFWRALVEELKLPRRLAGLSFFSRLAAGPLLRTWVAAKLRRRPLRTWLSRLGKRGLPVTPILEPREVETDPQIASRALFGVDGLPRAPLPGTRHPSSPAPALGQHNDDVFAMLEHDAPQRQRSA